MINSSQQHKKVHQEEDIQLPKRFFPLKRLLKVGRTRPREARQARSAASFIYFRHMGTFKTKIYLRDSLKGNK